MRTFPVALTRCDSYDHPDLQQLVQETIMHAGWPDVGSARVLVKPNLLTYRNNGLAATRAEVVAAVCRTLLDLGARVRVADSPAMGSAYNVARRIGLVKALAPYSIQVETLDNPQPLSLSFGSRVGVSAKVHEADMVVSLAKCKAHVQMVFTGAVKNLFGTVSSMRKPLAHCMYGEQANKFEAMIIEIMQSLPPCTGFMDGIVAMHETGPIDGVPFEMGLLGAASSPVALDTAMYRLLGKQPEELLLWQESLRRNFPDACAENLVYPLAQLSDFDVSGFVFPAKLKPVSFHPARLLKGACRRGWNRLSGQ